MSKTINDVLEYLYKQGEKELAKAVVTELKGQQTVIRESHTTREIPTQPNPLEPPKVWYGKAIC